MKYFNLITIFALSTYLVGCASTPPRSHFLQFYEGEQKSLTDVVVLRNIESKEGQEDEVKRIELYGINDVRFDESQGFGGGEYVVHLDPGTYTLYLRYFSVEDTESGAVTHKAKEDLEFTFIAQKGHTYMITGARVPSDDDELKWKPVLFDKTRVISWFGKKKMQQEAEESDVAISEE